MFLYPQSKGQTEEGIIQSGFQRVSIFHPGFLRVEEPRKNPRFLENTVGAILTPIHRYMGLHITIPVTSVGQAMRKVANQDATKPITETNTQVNYYSNKDMEDMVEQ